LFNVVPNYEVKHTPQNKNDCKNIAKLLFQTEQKIQSLVFFLPFPLTDFQADIVNRHIFTVGMQSAKISVTAEKWRFTLINDDQQ